MLSSSALITMGPQGATHKETVTPETQADGEYLHVWISKENPQNAIEMIIYNEKQSQGGSVLINHNVPFAQEMWGDCTGM